MSSLSQALIWTTAGTGVTKLASLLRLLAITAVVSVEDIGTYAIAASLTAAAGAVGHGGLRQQYLSRQSDALCPSADLLLSTTWAGILISRSIIVILATFFSFIASLVIDADRSLLIGMTALLACASLVEAAANPALLAAERERNFTWPVKVESIGQTVSLIGLLAGVLIWPSIWLIALSQLAYAASCVLASYGLAPALRLPAPAFALMGRLVVNGRPFFTISVMAYITKNLDKILIGALLSPAAAGLYFVAQRVVDVPGQLYSTTLGRTALPHYAHELSARGLDGIRQASRHYLHIVSGAYAVLIVLAIAAFFLLADLSFLEPWQDALALMPLLLVGEAFRMACHTVSPALLTTGRAAIDARLKIMEAIAFVPLIFAGIQLWGLYGAASAFVLIYVVALLQRLAALRRLLQERKA